MSKNKFKTTQEEFWVGRFGNDYIARNSSDELMASNVFFFSQALKKAKRINTCVDMGANVGMHE